MSLKWPFEQVSYNDLFEQGNSHIDRPAKAIYL
jgi:hypothetical protein